MVGGYHDGLTPKSVGLGLEGVQKTPKVGVGPKNDPMLGADEGWGHHDASAGGLNPMDVSMWGVGGTLQWV